MSSILQKLQLCAEYGHECSRDDIKSGFRSTDLMTLWFASKVAGLTQDQFWIEDLKRCATMKIPGDDPDVNSIAIWALSKIGGIGVREFWKSAAMSSSPHQRRAAADLIGLMADEEGRGVLESLLRDDDDNVSSWAALSLSKLGEGSKQVLIEYLMSSVSLRCATYCVDALLKLEPRFDLKPAIAVIAGRNQGLADEVSSIVDKLISLKHPA